MGSITPLKLLLGIVFIFGLGAIAVNLQHNPRQMATDSYMLNTKVLAERAREVCPEAVRKHDNKLILGSPNDSVSDGNQKITLYWQAQTGNPAVVCTYVLDQGVQSLTIDGKSVGS